MTSQSTFLKEINREINSVNKELKDIEIQIELVKKDPNHYLENLYASKKFYQLLIDKFQVALKKAKLEAIRDGKTYNYMNCIKPVYLHKIDQFRQFKRNAPRRLH